MLTSDGELGLLFKEIGLLCHRNSLPLKSGKIRSHEYIKRSGLSEITVR